MTFYVLFYFLFLLIPYLVQGEGERMVIFTLLGLNILMKGKRKLCKSFTFIHLLKPDFLTPKLGLIRSEILKC